MKRVLVTAIGTMTSTAIVKGLKKLDHVTVLGANSLPAHQTVTSLEVDEYYQFPSVVDNPSLYAEFVLPFCIENQVTHYFASIDEEVSIISDMREKFAANGIRLCVPNEEVVSTCHYKDKFAEWIHENIPEIEIKTYIDPNEVSESDLPIFVKPIEGRASVGCSPIKTPEELAAIKTRNSRNMICQELVEGENVTVDIVRSSQNGQIYMLPRRELMRNGNGCGIAVETFCDEELSYYCHRLATLLNLNGVINAEFFKTESGYKIIEVNPRFSAGSEYSALCGFDTVKCALEIADGEPLSQTDDILTGRCLAKRYETYLMN